MSTSPLYDSKGVVRKMFLVIFFVCPTLFKGSILRTTECRSRVRLWGCFYILILCDRLEWTHINIWDRSHAAVYEGGRIRALPSYVSDCLPIIPRGFSYSVVVTSVFFVTCLITVSMDFIFRIDQFFSVDLNFRIFRCYISIFIKLSFTYFWKGGFCILSVTGKNEFELFGQWKCL